MGEPFEKIESKKIEPLKPKDNSVPDLSGDALKKIDYGNSALRLGERARLTNEISKIDDDLKKSPTPNQGESIEAFKERLRASNHESLVLQRFDLIDKLMIVDSEYAARKYPIEVDNIKSGIYARMKRDYERRKK